MKTRFSVAGAFHFKRSPGKVFKAVWYTFLRTIFKKGSNTLF